MMQRAEDTTVLVVEDEPDVRLFLQTALEDAGFNVLAAADGEEALDMIRQHKPDFISLDLILPRKTGPRLMHELKRDKELAKIPVLIVTAHAKTDLGKKALEDLLDSGTMSGPGSYLEKPVKASTYVHCVQRALGIEESPDPDDKIGLKEELQDAMRAASPDALRKALEAIKHS
jgi:CheY-like chemotaxis protein